MYPSHDWFCIIYHASKQILTRKKKVCQSDNSLCQSLGTDNRWEQERLPSKKKKRKERNQPIKEETRLRGVAQGLFDP